MKWSTHLPLEGDEGVSKIDFSLIFFITQLDQFFLLTSTDFTLYHNIIFL